MIIVAAVALAVGWALAYGAYAYLSTSWRS